MHRFLVAASLVAVGCVSTGEVGTSPASEDAGGSLDSAPSLDGATSDTASADTALADTASTDTGLADTASADTAITDSSTGGGLSTLVTATTWDAMFPNRNKLFSYAAFVEAAKAFPAFGSEGSDEVRRRELAALLANTAHETTGGWDTAPGGRHAWGLYFIEEVGCETGACTGYCDSTSAYKCVAGVTYHGRGPIQLSWNYNYGQFGVALGLDLLSKPQLVTTDGVVAWKTALWFWMTPQAPKPSAHDVMVGKWTPTSADLAAGRQPGFGMTVNIINGGLECNIVGDSRVKDRIGFYSRFVTMLSTSEGANVNCDAMKPF